MSSKVHGAVFLNSFLTRAQRPDIQDCLKKSEIKPTQSLKCPTGCLTDGVHKCAVDKSVPSFKLPTLTIAAELDGLVRITRIAEAFYTQSSVAYKHPVVVIPAASHASVLNEGVSLSSKITDLDLKAEISNSVAASQVAQVVRSFILNISGVNSIETSVLQHKVTEASTYFAPIIEAFVQLEGNWFFTGGDEENGSSGWAAGAQQLLASPTPVAVHGWGKSTNEFHLLSDEDKIPPYFRPMHRASIDANTIDSTTIAQLRFVEVSLADVGIGLNGFGIIKEEKTAILGQLSDNGESFVSAIEIATKMRSRQYLFNVTNASEGAADSLDDGNRCADINQRAINWAISKLSLAAANRYASGRKIIVSSDIKPFPPAGPFFIWKYITLEESSSTLTVSSPYGFYSMSSNPYGAGTHYCKLLSPARALEFMLVDSLRSAPKKPSLRISMY